MKFTRITVNPNQMGGVPCIRRLTIPVATVVVMVAEGMMQFMFVSIGYNQQMTKLSLQGPLQKTALSFLQTGILALY